MCFDQQDYCSVGVPHMFIPVTYRTVWITLVVLIMLWVSGTWYRTWVLVIFRRMLYQLCYLDTKRSLKTRSLCLYSEKIFTEVKFCVMKQSYVVASISSNFFCLLLGCPTANFRTWSREQPLSPDVDHCELSFDTKITALKNFIMRLGSWARPNA